MKALLVIGPPGCGKGTQSSKLADKFNWVKISTGDILRDNIKRRTPIGEKAAFYCNQGLLVPGDLVFNLIKNEILNFKNKTLILDGYPRNINQAKSLFKINKLEIFLILNIKTNFENLKKRILKRALTESRTDDDIEKLNTRINIFKNEIYNLIDFYKYDYNICNIDGNQNIDDVFKSILNVVTKFI